MINKLLFFLICLTVIGCTQKSRQSNNPLSIDDLKELRADYTDVLMFDTLIANVYSEEFDLNISDTLDLYYYQGKLKQVSQVRWDKKLNYKHFEFNSNGKLYFIGQYSNNKPEGIFRSYDTLGKIREISVYINGNITLNFNGQELDDLDINPDWREDN